MLGYTTHFVLRLTQPTPLIFGFYVGWVRTAERLGVTQHFLLMRQNLFLFPTPFCGGTPTPARVKTAIEHKLNL